MFTTLGGRRFLLTALAVCLTWLLAVFGKLDSSNYMMAVLGLVTVYVTGNTVQKLKTPDDAGAVVFGAEEVKTAAK